MVKLIFLSSLISIIFTGCVMVGTYSSISDGEMNPIGEWNVHATINCEPNKGHLGIPVKITIYFDRGGSLVDYIQAWQAYDKTLWEFVRTPEIDPENEKLNTWSIWKQLVLSGEPGVVRFYALNGDTPIASGDINVNGGRP